MAEEMTPISGLGGARFAISNCEIRNYGWPATPPGGKLDLGSAKSLETAPCAAQHANGGQDGESRPVCVPGASPHCICGRTFGSRNPEPENGSACVSWPRASTRSERAITAPAPG